MDIEIETMFDDKIKLNKLKFRKMTLIFNALENGWSIKKKNNVYIFNKKHEGKIEIYSDEYLTTFMRDNLTTTNLL